MRILHIVPTSYVMFGVLAALASLQAEARSALAAVPEHRAAPHEERTPEWLRLDSRIVEIVAEARRRSRTIRDQWDRLSAERTPLQVAIRLRDATDHRKTRATSDIIVEANGLVQVAISVPWSPRFAELLAHELEHVIEYLDGVRVRDVYRTRGHSVHQGESGYETARARSVGLRAYDEYRGGRLRP